MASLLLHFTHPLVSSAAAARLRPALLRRRAAWALGMLTLGLLCAPAYAVDATATSQGFTGFGLTPSAARVSPGYLQLNYQNQLPGAASPTGHNVVAAFGVNSFVEVAGRMAANSLNCRFDYGECGKAGGLRDLSASGKFGITLGDQQRLHLALGATDVGGAATNFRAIYGVATYDAGPWAASAGVAQRPSSAAATTRSPLHGPFANLVYQPGERWQVYGEWVGNTPVAGGRVFLPSSWLPSGWQAHLGVNARLSNSAVTDRVWAGLGIAIPLFDVPKLALPAAGKLPAPGPVAATNASSSEASATPPVAPLIVPLGEGNSPIAVARQAPFVAPDKTLRALANALQRWQFEDISVGRNALGAVVVSVNNDAYRWNSLDALGVALGGLAKHLGDGAGGYVLVLNQRQQPLVALQGETACIRTWIAAGQQAECSAGLLMTPGQHNLAALTHNVTWVVRQQASSHKLLRLALTPVLRTRIATEFGALDYSAGLEVSARQPLYPGLTADYAHIVPLTHSADFKAGGVFADSRLQARMSKAALVYTTRVPLERLVGARTSRPAPAGLYALNAALTVGQINEFYRGIHAEARWEPGDGRHRLGLEAAHLQNRDAVPIFPFARTSTPLLAHYRFNLIETRSHLEASAGTFLNTDRGFRLGFKQWFADTALTFVYRRSRFENSLAPMRQFAGIEFSVPFGPRVDSGPIPGLPVKFQGSGRFSHTIESVVRAENGANVVTPGYGERTRAAVLDDTFNSDRASLLYFEDNLRRIRDAASLSVN